MLVIMLLMIAFVMLMQYIGFDNGGLIFCMLGIFMYSSVGIYSYMHRNDVMKSLLNHFKGDTKKAEEYYSLSEEFYKNILLSLAVLFCWQAYGPSSDNQQPVPGRVSCAGNRLYQNRRKGFGKKL